jgi:hypothetical protein
MRLHLIIVALLLVIQTAYCWFCFYNAQFLDYDDNYGLLIHSFFIAFVTLILLLIIWLRNRQILKKVGSFLLIWLVSGSPVTFILAALNYESIFGITLKN